MTDAGVWYIIIGLAVAGIWTVLLVAVLVDAAWAGRRRFPR